VLLLVAVTLGLGAMHTLGHTGMAHPMAAAETHPPAALSSMMSGAQPVAAAAALMWAPVTTEVVAAGRVLPLGADTRHGDGSWGSWSVCLAVLAAATLLLMLSRLRRLRRASPFGSRVWLAGVTAATRAPPPRYGLRVADLSVVRR
jgi:hypothetical protein